MINCTCVIQEGQSPDLRKGEMQSILKSFASRSFGQEAQISWIPVAEGNGFTAGESSTSSVVSFTAHEQLSPERRERLLRELVALWSERTGCTVDEIVAVIADPATH